jgi:hypothetical protein
LFHPALQEVRIRLIEDVPEAPVAPLEDRALEQARLVLGKEEVDQRHIDAIVYSGHSQEIQGTPPQPEASPSGIGSSTADQNEELLALKDDYSDAEQVIRRHCEREWPENYNMRNYCTKQQRRALSTLKQGRPQDIPEEVFAEVRSKCAAEWPEDYGMRQYCEKQQFDSYRELERGSE